MVNIQLYSVQLCREEKQIEFRIIPALKLAKSSKSSHKKNIRKMWLVSSVVLHVEVQGISTVRGIDNLYTVYKCRSKSHVGLLYPTVR